MAEERSEAGEQIQSSQHTRASLLQELELLEIDPKGTLLVHSSMKSIGKVEGGPHAVLDALTEYMSSGLLVLPTHTWAYLNSEGYEFRVAETPSNVGLLTELFRQRPGVFRSLHPSHSVAACGVGAEAFVSGDEQYDTPCARGSVWGKLWDRQAQILLIGIDLTRNTFFHGVEEWLDIPGRISESHKPLYTVKADGTRIFCPLRGHTAPVSENYFKVEELLLEKGAMRKGRFGNAEARVCDAAKSAELLTSMLRIQPDLFTNDAPVQRHLFSGIL